MRTVNMNSESLRVCIISGGSLSFTHIHKYKMYRSKWMGIALSRIICDVYVDKALSHKNYHDSFVLLHGKWTIELSKPRSTTVQQRVTSNAHILLWIPSHCKSTAKSVFRRLRIKSIRANQQIISFMVAHCHRHRSWCPCYITLQSVHKTWFR